MRLFLTETCFHNLGSKNVRLLPCLLPSSLFPLFGFRSWLVCFFSFVLLVFHFHFLTMNTSSFGSSCIMTKRDSALAGFTSPSSSMSMPRRPFRPHGIPSSAASSVPSSHHLPSGTGITESTTLPSSSDTHHHELPSPYGYSTEPPPVPLPPSADNQHPIIPAPTEHFNEKWNRDVANSMPISSLKSLILLIQILVASW